MKVRRLQLGEVFAGRFAVDGFVGQGAMGTVYRVVDRLNGEQRALKVMSFDLVSTPGFVERFVQEAKIGERIRSDHVVKVFDTGVDEATQLPYFTMELLDGEDLQHKLDRGEELERPVVHRLLRTLFEAIGAAHAAQVVHRDLKPENLFVVSGPDGPRLKVLDFGVAKVFKETTTVSGTTPGLGAPLWTAPEQGREGQSIRPPADVWALGLLTYRLLAGKHYWREASNDKANAFDLAMELLRAPLVLASERSRQIGARDLGPAFDAWFARSVDRDPARRYADAGAALADLTPILEGPALTLIAAPPESPTEPRPSRSVILLAIATITLLSAFTVGWALWR